VATIDYLIKLFPPEDLARAIDRFRQRQTPTNLPELVHAVAYIEADGHYVKVLQDNGKSFAAFESISEVEQKLPAGIFFRAGRSLILNRHFIQSEIP
jgi:DNA-binding LytR/AlgR family response regulator